MSLPKFLQRALTISHHDPAVIQAAQPAIDAARAAIAPAVLHLTPAIQQVEHEAPALILSALERAGVASPEALASPAGRMAAELLVQALQHAVERAIAPHA